MYVGDVHDGSGLHHLLWELVANALDEHLAGRATRVDVIFNEGGSVTVEDDGAGIPTHDVEGIPFPQRALTTFHSTGTFDGHAPHAHVGLLGVGIFAVNALSTTLVLDVFRDARHYRQHYAEGVPQTSFEDLGHTDRHGTRLTFTPDPTIFTVTDMSFTLVDSRLRELALMNPGLRFELRDDRRLRRSHRHPEGLRGFLSRPNEALCCRGTVVEVHVDTAMAWRKRWQGIGLKSFANQEPTSEHGSHIEGLMQGIADVVVPELPVEHRHSVSVLEELAEGLEAVVHVTLANRTFGNPTKERLTSPAAREAVRTIVAEQLGSLFQEKPEVREMLRRRFAESGALGVDA